MILHLDVDDKLNVTQLIYSIENRRVRIMIFSGYFKVKN